MRRAPDPEERVAAGLHVVRHSAGLVVIPDAGRSDVSFRIEADGELVELAGWGYAGKMPDLGAAGYSNSNVPPGPLCVHTVAVAGAGPEVLAALRRLMEEHLERYREGGVFTSLALPRAIAGWVQRGCPPPATGGTPDKDDEAETEPAAAAT